MFLREVSAGDAAVGVEVDLHFGHRELERTALEAPRAEDHRQLVHPREQRIDFGREIAEDALGWLFCLPSAATVAGVIFCGQILVDFFVREAAAALDRAI